MNIQELLVMVINLLILPLVGYGLVLLKNWIMLKVESERMIRVITITNDAVNKAVADTAQTFVDEIKGTDQWNADTMKQAMNQSLRKARKILGADGIKLLESYTHEVNDYLVSAIEEAVRRD